MYLLRGKHIALSPSAFLLSALQYDAKLPGHSPGPGNRAFSHLKVHDTQPKDRTDPSPRAQHREMHHTAITTARHCVPARCERPESPLSV